jgi:hypothetical protein
VEPGEQGGAFAHEVEGELAGRDLQSLS